jgi:hypothetical protein
MGQGGVRITLEPGHGADRASVAWLPLVNVSHKKCPLHAERKHCAAGDDVGVETFDQMRA